MSIETNPEIEGSVNVEGGSIRYKIYGAEKAGIPILVLHGGPGISHKYLQPLIALSKRQPIIFYDQLGCGDSDKPNDESLWTIERYVRELQTLVSELELKNFHLIGQSWGTTLAVEYMLASKNQANIISLVLSAPLFSTARWIADQSKYLLELSEESQAIILEAEKTGNYSSEQYENSVMEFYGKHLCRLPEWPDYLVEASNGMNLQIYNKMWGPSEFSVIGTLKNYSNEDKLEELKLPVLITCGRFDEATPESCEIMKSKIDGSELYIFEEASHTHHIENEGEYLQVVSNFLEKCEKGF